MGILEFFGLGNSTPAPTPETYTDDTGRHSDTGVEETTPDNEVAHDEVSDDDNPEQGGDTPAPEAVAEDEAETASPAPEAVAEPSDVHRALHAALVRLDGRLSDPAALPYDEAHLTDDEALSAAVTALIERSPHLSATAVAGDVGQGDRGAPPEPFDLIATMRRAHGITSQ